MHLARLLLASLILSACVTSWGCKKGHGWGYGVHARGGTKETNYDILHFTCDGRVYLVLAADHCDGGWTESGPTAQGHLRVVGGRKIVWSCATQDGTSGNVVIDGRPFDLAQGGVFLIWAKDKAIKVDQLALDMSKLQGGKVQDRLAALADTDPRLAAFFKDWPGKK